VVASVLINICICICICILRFQHIPKRNELIPSCGVRRPSVCLSVCLSVNICTHRFFSPAHDGPQVGLHPGYAQGQCQGQKSRDVGTFVILRKSLFLTGKWKDRHQTSVGWCPRWSESGICSRSRLWSKFTWYGHFCDFTKNKIASFPRQINVWIVNKLTPSLTSASLSPFPFLLLLNPQITVSLRCEFCRSSHRETVWQTVCYTVRSHVLSLLSHTLWSTITLSFQAH